MTNEIADLRGQLSQFDKKLTEQDINLKHIQLVQAHGDPLPAEILNVFSLNKTLMRVPVKRPLAYLKAKQPHSTLKAKRSDKLRFDLSKGSGNQTPTLTKHVNVSEGEKAVKHTTGVHDSFVVPETHPKMRIIQA